jgi:hypothetical protein
VKPDGLTSLWTEDFHGLRAQVVGMGPDRKRTTYYDPGYVIEHSTVSPNGRLIAFTSNQSGRREVFGSAGDVTFGRPEPLFDAPIRDGLDYRVTQYDVAPDGRRFLFNAVREAPPNPSFTVMLSWSRGEGRR